MTKTGTSCRAHASGRRRAGRTAGRTVGRRMAAALGVAVIVPALLAGCALFAGAEPVATPTRTKHATPTPTKTPGGTATGAVGSATVTPSAPPVPAATMTPVPQGTVVAEGDVASPKGSIHFHYRMVANGDNTYTAEYSKFTSTVPVPVSVTLIDIAPDVGDGLTYHGVGDHQLGGPTTAQAPSSTSLLGNVGQPSYLGTLVTYSSAPSADGTPVELGPDKVLAVNSIHWSVPVRPSNVHPVDSGARAGAGGAVTATTAAGAPKRYAVAQGDNPSDVAARFQIPVEYVLWLNPDLPGDGGNQFLYAGTTLNLDPDSL